MKEKATGQIQQIQDDLKRSGLPAAAFAMLPAIVAVFGVAGLPAFGVAALSYLATNRAAAKKMLEFQEFVYSGLKGLEVKSSSLTDKIKACEKHLAMHEESITLLRDSLTAEQLEQLGVLFEQYMRTLNGKRLVLLQNAVQGVAGKICDDASNQVVIASLASLHESHIRELQRINLVAKDARYRPHSRELRQACKLLQPPLIAVGFVVLKHDVQLRDRGSTSGTGIVKGVEVAQTEFVRITELGIAALELLQPGPLDPLNDGSPSHLSILGLR